MAARYQINGDHIGHQHDIGMRSRRGFQCLLHCPSCGIINMDDAAVAMSALTRQVPVIALKIKRHAQLCQPLNGNRRIFDNKFDCRTVIQPGPRDHCIFDMVCKIVAGLKHRGDAPLRPGCRTIGYRALCQHGDFSACCELQRCG